MSEDNGELYGYYNSDEVSCITMMCKWVLQLSQHFNCDDSDWQL